MTHKQLEYLKQKVRVTFTRGEAVAVIGWKGSNHSALTRKFLRSKQVSFHFELKNNLGQNTGFAMRTRFNRHASRDRLKSRGIEFYPGLVTIGMMKQVLESCEDLLIVKVSQSATLTKEQPAMEHSAKAETPAKVVSITTAKSVIAGDMCGFARAFSEWAADHDGIVGSGFLARMRKEYGIERIAQQLLVTGWLKPHTAPGSKKVSGYTAGEKMREMSSGESFEPDDPVEKAEFLIAQEPSLLEEKNKLTDRLKKIDDQLERIKRAKDILRQLDEI